MSEDTAPNILECIKCHTKGDLNLQEWDHFALKGYQVKKLECKCGNNPYVVRPFSKEQKALWENLLAPFNQGQDA